MVSDLETRRIGQSFGADQQVDKLSDKKRSVIKEDGAPLRNQLDKSGYKVNLSDSARDLSQAQKKAFNIAKGTSPLRNERIDQLKKEVMSGQYAIKIDPGNIADGLLTEAIKDRLAEDKPS